MTQDTESELKETGIARPRLYGIAVLVVVIAMAGLFLISRYISFDMARDMRTWQEKLNLIAESRASALTDYVNDHFRQLHALADNPSLQLYLTELEMMPDGTRGQPPAQMDYLRNLLIFTAQRGGYAASQSGASTIPANVESDATSGLAVVNTSSQIVVSTNMPLELKQRLLGNIVDVRGAGDVLIDIKRADDGTLYMGYVVPVFSIQGDRSEDSVMGRVVGIRQVDESFFRLLQHPGVVEKTLEAVLVRDLGERIQYLTPLMDRSEPLAKEVPKTARRNAEVKLVASPGDFLSDLKDYANKRVLATSRKIPGTDWIMVVKVERDEALRASSQNRNNMIALFFTIIVLVLVLIIAIWWYSVSRRSLFLSYHFRRLASAAQAKEKLLRLVADNQPESIFILDHDHHYRFANKRAADEAGMSPDAVAGKHVRDVRGTAVAQHIAHYADEAAAQGDINYHIAQIAEPEGARTLRSAFVPVGHIPITGLPNPTPGVLVVEQDITDMVTEREKRMQINQDLIDTLVTLVDRRDPFAANHSLIVSTLAWHVAQQMELSEVAMETTRISASLMNIGKIVISPKLLTKTAPLSDDERRIIRDSMTDAAELVKPIHFDGPVYETLRQWQEKFDGSGHLGMQGEDILIEARILAVANTFVGMISPRSWRSAITKEEAIRFLMNNCGTLFDRKVVVALVHFLENQHGNEWLERVLRTRDAA